jgi:hypothetical protein
VIECECQNPERCHIGLTDGGAPVCQGFCPDGMECRRIEHTLDDGTVQLECDCVEVVTECHGEIGPDGNLVCVGHCPPGEVCRKVQVINDDGTVTEDCDCVPILQECEPNADSPTGCAPVVCPDPTKRCLPSKMECTAAGCRVIECECQNPERCHIGLTDGGAPVCQGFCPDGLECRRIEHTLDDGTVQLECDCVEVVTECHGEIGPDGNLVCVGHCPPGEVCRKVQVINDDGTVTEDCDCVPILQECEPNADSPTGCAPVVCPDPRQRCLPSKMECTAAGCRVIECECQNPERCHIGLTDGGAPVCQGFCPDGLECRHFVGPGDNGTIEVRCGCRDE